MSGRKFFVLCVTGLLLAMMTLVSCSNDGCTVMRRSSSTAVQINHSVAHDVSPALASLTANTAVARGADPDDDEDEIDLPKHVVAPRTESEEQEQQSRPAAPTQPTISAAAVAVEQTAHGSRPAPRIVASFDGLGVGFEGPQGTAIVRNPSDNSLAVGPDHIVQIVNSKMAVFTKKGAKFDTTGKVLYGPVNTNNIFNGFGDGAQNNNGDAVVRYDQLADRWLIVMPIFRRVPMGDRQAPANPGDGGVQISRPGVKDQPGGGASLDIPERGLATAPRGARGPTTGPYAICYAVSTGPDPLGSYYRYEFLRPLFPDYPRPAVWPDGYYVTTSTGDTVIQKHAFVVDRAKILKGEDATEQGFIVDGVNFLIPADLDGKQLPPAGAPAIVLAAGGTQLRGVLDDDGIYAWSFHVDWNDPSKSKLEGPKKIAVAPYHYLGGGQLSNAVPQPDSRTRLDSQGDKLMARVVYRRIDNRESIVAVHSISTSAGGGGVRWYELRIDADRNLKLQQQGTYAPEGFYRWMASPAIDTDGNLGIGYSFGGTPNYPGQRFAGRLSDDAPGQLTLHETVLAEGEASQNGLRWEDYSQTAVDPSDDRTIWYVGDYLKKGATSYSSRIGAFRIER